VLEGVEALQHSKLVVAARGAEAPHEGVGHPPIMTAPAPLMRSG
jgi:hypothetical protein